MTLRKTFTRNEERVKHEHTVDLNVDAARSRAVLNQRMHTSAFHGDAEAQLLVDKGFALFGYGSLVWKQGTLKVSSPRGGFINVSDCAPRLLVGDAGVHMT